MNRLKIYILILLPLILGACSNELIDTEVSSEDQAGLEEIRLGVSPVVTLSGGTVATRGTVLYEGTLSDDQYRKFGVFVFDEPTFKSLSAGTAVSSYNYFYDNVYATYSSTDASLTTPYNTLYYPYGKDSEDKDRMKVGIAAYTPYDVSMKAGTPAGAMSLGVSVLTDQSTDERVKKCDLLVGYPEENPIRLADKATVPLKMTHVMTQVYLDITLSVSEPTYCDYITVEADDFCIEGTMNMATGKITPTYPSSGSTQILMAKYDGLRTSQTERKITATALIPPQTIESGNPAHFTVTLYNEDTQHNKQVVRVFTITPSTYPIVFEKGTCVKYTGNCSM